MRFVEFTHRISEMGLVGLVDREAIHKAARGECSASEHEVSGGPERSVSPRAEVAEIIVPACREESYERDEQTRAGNVGCAAKRPAVVLIRIELGDSSRCVLEDGPQIFAVTLDVGVAIQSFGLVYETALAVKLLQRDLLGQRRRGGGILGDFGFFGPVSGIGPLRGQAEGKRHEGREGHARRASRAAFAALAKDASEHD